MPIVSQRRFLGSGNENPPSPLPKAEPKVEFQQNQEKKESVNWAKWQYLQNFKIGAYITTGIALAMVYNTKVQASLQQRQISVARNDGKFQDEEARKNLADLVKKSAEKPLIIPLFNVERPDVEQQLMKMITDPWFGVDHFAIVVYGEKAHGKTTALGKALKNCQRVKEIDIELDVESSLKDPGKDIKAFLQRELGGTHYDQGLQHIAELLGEMAKDGDKVVIRVHVTKLSGSGDLWKAYVSLVKALRSLCAAPGVGVVIEMSKGWIFTTSEDVRVEKFQVGAFTHDEFNQWCDKAEQSGRLKLKWEGKDINRITLAKITGKTPGLLDKFIRGTLEQEVRSHRSALQNTIDDGFAVLLHKLLTAGEIRKAHLKDNENKQLEQLETLHSQNIVEYDEKARKFYLHNPAATYVLHELLEKK